MRRVRGLSRGYPWRSPVTCHPGTSPTYAPCPRRRMQAPSPGVMLIASARLGAATSRNGGGSSGTRERFRQGVDLGRRRGAGSRLHRELPGRSWIEFTDHGQDDDPVLSSELPRGLAYPTPTPQIICRRASESITELPKQAQTSAGQVTSASARHTRPDQHLTVAQYHFQNARPIPSSLVYLLWCKLRTLSGADDAPRHLFTPTAIVLRA